MNVNEWEESRFAELVRLGVSVQEGGVKFLLLVAQALVLGGVLVLWELVVLVS